MRIVNNRKLLSVFTSLVMVVALFPFSSLADAKTSDSSYDGPSSVSQEITLSNDIYLEETDDVSFDDYINNAFYGDDSLDLYSGAGDGILNASNQNIYNQLEAAIKEIAQGKRTSTKINLNWLPDQVMSWNEDTLVSDLGLSPYDEAITQGKYSETLDAAIDVRLKESLDDDLVLSCLLDNLPYDLFWFSKAVGGAKFSKTISFTPLGSKVFCSISLYVAFTVSDEYADPNDSSHYTVSSNIASASSAATKAVSNAKSIVNRYVNMPDSKKLLAYKDEICNLVDYDHTAASLSSYSYNSNAWQLIWVFDDNPNTKVVCEGYAKAFQYLCDLSTFDTDVKARIVTGRLNGAAGSGGHMWNLVDLDGSTYLADITNSDSESVGSAGQLFLAGTNTGSVNKGYTFVVSRTTCNYIYDEDTRSAYLLRDLTLADKSYVFDISSDENNGSDPDDQKPSTDPTDPTGPTNPTDPNNPTNPTDPNNPTNPTDPNDPIKPTNPVGSDEPTTPSGPDDSSQPDNPSTPSSSASISHVSTTEWPDGSKLTVTLYTDGTKVVEEVSSDGKVKRSSLLPNGIQIAEALNTDVPISLKIPFISDTSTISLPIDKIKPEVYIPSVITPKPMIFVSAERSTKIQVPVDGVYPNTTAVVIDNDNNVTSIPKCLAGNNSLSFEVPGGQHKVAIIDSCIAFSDIDPAAWYSKEGVTTFASTRGLITGIKQSDGSTKFEADLPMTRAMLATVLYRLEGCQDPDQDAVFDDISQGEWYSDAVAWAAQNGIIKGYGGTNNFGPHDNITREQLVLMLDRYAAKFDIKSKNKANLNIFSDAHELTYGKSSMEWAVGAGLIKGYSNTSSLAPTASATRAEISAIMMRFIALLFND